ncbi:MAG: HAMP domain-containing histidine kinase [Clostridia bacterium]|nr:HAMP domain-containing histidine kinase [Clostridia bacterium]
MTNKIARRLTRYFVLALLLFAMVVGILFSLMFARHTADVTRRDLLAHADSIAQTFAHFTQECEEGECRGGGFKAYMRYIGDAAMSDLYLLDARGENVTLGDMQPPEKQPTQQALALAERVFESGETADSGFSLNPFHTGEMMVCAPVPDEQGGVKYALVMCMPVDSVAHTLQDAFYMLTACLGISMAIAIGASGVLSRRFVNPLHRMLHAATQMAQGDYSVKTHLAQNDEIGVLAAQIDVLADRLDEAQRERNRFDQLRQDFLTDISHELRTPISVLIGSIELLKEEMIKDPEQRRQYFEQLYTDANHLQRLVGDLLELGRLQNTQFNIEMDTINLIDVLADSVRFMRQKAAEKRVNICQETATPFAVLGDYGRLRQMMIILMDNAIKFSPEGAEVCMEIRRKENVCEVSVVDHGCGIAKEELEHVFDRYFHNRSRKNRGGTGLGLPIAREIAIRHGVAISCSSKVNEGTRFTLVFTEHPMEEA